MLPGIAGIAGFAGAGAGDSGVTIPLVVGFETNVNDEGPLAHTGTLVQVSSFPQLSTTQAKFGSQSLRQASGGSGRLTYPNGSEWPNGTDMWTLEGWFYRNGSAPSFEGLIAKYDNGNNNRELAIMTASGQLKLWMSSTGTANITKINSTTTLTTGVWAHVAADWDGTTYRLYKDGTMIGSATGAVSLFNGTAPVSLLGILNGGNGNNGFNGYCDECRISVGVARYASDGGYTVPSAAFPRS